MHSCATFGVEDCQHLRHILTIAAKVNQFLWFFKHLVKLLRAKWQMLIPFVAVD